MSLTMFEDNRDTDKEIPFLPASQEVLPDLNQARTPLLIAQYIHPPHSLRRIYHIPLHKFLPQPGTVAVHYLALPIIIEF